MEGTHSIFNYQPLTPEQIVGLKVHADEFNRLCEQVIESERIEKDRRKNAHQAERDAAAKERDLAERAKKNRQTPVTKRKK